MIGVYVYGHKTVMVMTKLALTLYYLIVIQPSNNIPTYNLFSNIM